MFAFADGYLFWYIWTLKSISLIYGVLEKRLTDPEDNVYLKMVCFLVSNY